MRVAHREMDQIGLIRSAARVAHAAGPHLDASGQAGQPQAIDVSICASFILLGGEHDPWRGRLSIARFSRC